MKKFAIVLAVLSLLVLGQVTYAANLQSDWYVKLFGISLYGWDGQQYQVVDWNFKGGLGQSGPFQVTNPDPVRAERMVSIPNSTSNTPIGTSVYLWGEPARPINWTINEIAVGYDTSYNAAQMRLELLMYKEQVGYTLLWSQNNTGTSWGIHNVLSNSQYIPAGYQPVFRVTVVPEPAGIMIILPCLALLFSKMRRESS